MKKLILSALFCISMLSPIQAMAKPIAHVIVPKPKSNDLINTIDKNNCKILEIRSLDQDKDGYVLVIYE